MKYFIAVLFCCMMLSVSTAQVTGKKYINVKLENTDGKYVELKNYIGKGPVLLSFWATWCKPCVEEMGELNKIYKELSPKGLNIIALATDNEKSVSKVKPFVKSKNYPFVFLLDTNSDAAKKYYAQAVPYSVLIDKHGNIVYTHLGYMKGDEITLKNKIAELLK